MICCYYCVAIPWWVFHSALFVASRVRCTSVWKTAVYRHITTASYSYSPFSEFLHPICVEHFSVAVFFILSCFIYFLIHVILCINVCMFSLIPPLVAMLQWTCVCGYSYGSKSPSAAAAAFHWAVGADIAHYQPGLCHSVAVHPHHGSCRHCIFSRLVYRMSHCLDRHSAVNVAGDCEMSMRLFVLVYRLNVIVVWVFCCT